MNNQACQLSDIYSGEALILCIFKNIFFLQFSFDEKLMQIETTHETHKYYLFAYVCMVHVFFITVIDLLILQDFSVVINHLYTT